MNKTEPSVIPDLMAFKVLFLWVGWSILKRRSRETGKRDRIDLWYGGMADGRIAGPTMTIVKATATTTTMAATIAHFLFPFMAAHSAYFLVEACSEIRHMICCI
jgi:hypothetical protein